MKQNQTFFRVSPAPVYRISFNVQPDESKRWKRFSSDPMAVEKQTGSGPLYGDTVDKTRPILTSKRQGGGAAFKNNTSNKLRQKFITFPQHERGYPS